MTDADRNEVGRRLGHDQCVYGRADFNQDWPTSIKEGYLQAKTRISEAGPPDRFVRKWLQLRMGAFARDRLFDEAVTPAMLRKIDAKECPVLRVPLTHCELKPSDWSIDRINNDGAYALHNLAVISTLVNSAKGHRNFSEVYALAQLTTPTEGLDPIHWLRLASVMLGPCFVEMPGRVPIIPLATPIPLLTARFPIQVLQQLFTLTVGSSSGRNAIVKSFKRACKSDLAKQRLVQLIEAIHFGLKDVAYPFDVWLSERVMRALIAWDETLDDKSRDTAAAIAQGMAQVGEVSMDRLKSWNLAGRGYLFSKDSE